MAVMKIFEKKSFVKIEKDDIDDAKLSSGDFRDSLTKKRAFVDVLGARLAMKLLFSKKIEAENIYSLYTIHSILEELDIADIYFQGIRMDVRLVFNQDEIFIPKSHFEYGLLPDMYIVLQLKQDFSGAEFLGFFQPKQLDKKNQNKEFYFFEYEKLSSPEKFKDFLDTFVVDGESNVSVDSLDTTEKMFLYLVDKEISDKDKAFLMKQLSASISLREKMVEFENFELLSMAAAHNKDLIQDGFMDIVGAQQIIEEGEENALTHDEFAQEVGLPIKQKMGLDSLLSEVDDVILSDSDNVLDDMVEESSSDEISQEVSERVENQKNNDAGVGHAIGGTLNVAAAGIALGGALIGAEAAQANAQAGVIKGGADVISSGVEALGHGIGSVSANIAESAAKASSSVSDSDFDLAELSGDDLTDSDLDSLDNLVDKSSVESNEGSLNIDEADSSEDLFDLSNDTPVSDSVLDNLVEDDSNEDLFDLNTQQISENTVDDLADVSNDNNDLFDLNAEIGDINEDSSLEALDSNDGISDNAPELVDLQNISEVEVPSIEEDVNQDDLVDLSSDVLGTVEDMGSLDSSAFEDSANELVGFDDLKSDLVDGKIDSDFADANLGDLPELKIQQDVAEQTNAQLEDVSEIVEQEVASEVEDKEPEVQENIIGQDDLFDDAEVSLDEIPTDDDSDQVVDLDNFDFDLLSDDSEPKSEDEAVQTVDNEIVDSGIIGDFAIEQEDLDELNSENPIQEPEQSQELMAEVDDFFNDIEISGEQDLEENIEGPEESTVAVASDSGTENPDKDLLKVLFQKEHIEENDDGDFGAYYAKGSLTDDNKKMIIAASVTSVILASFLVGGIVVSHNHNAAQMPQNVNSQTFAGNQNQGMDESSSMNSEANANQQGMPSQGAPGDALQGSPDAQAQGSQDYIGGSPAGGQTSSNGVFSEPVNATISKIAWEVPEDLAYNDSFRRYLQTAGKNLKLNLQNNLLLANEMAYSNKVVVDLQLTANGGVDASNITTSSGSKQIDNIVLQSVKETLQYLKMPASELGSRSVVATLIIRF